MCPGLDLNREHLTLITVALPLELPGRYPGQHNIISDESFCHDLRHINSQFVLVLLPAVYSLESF